MMKTVLFRGPVLTQSGYGVHARQVAKWLLSRDDISVKFQPMPWGNTPWMIDPKLMDGLVGKIINNSHAPATPTQYDISFQLQLPNEWDPTLARFNVGMTAGVETDRCNPSWVTACNTVDMCIFPSTHVHDTIKNTGILFRPDIKIIPESFIDDVGKDNVGNFPTEFSTKFNFLVFGQLTGDNNVTDRKNTFNTIKWLCDAFKDDPDVGIIIKTNMGRHSRMDKHATRTILKNALHECRKTAYPKVHLLHGDMSDEIVASLYRQKSVKALVSLTRGEGYGLPILEAAASGLPVITTGWSGHMDYMKLGKFINVEYSLLPVHKSRIDNKIFVQGARWAEPREDDFKRKIVKFRHNDVKPREWALDLMKTLLQKYDHDSVSRMYDSVLDEILKK